MPTARAYLTEERGGAGGLQYSMRYVLLVIELLHNERGVLTGVRCVVMLMLIVILWEVSVVQ